MRIAVRPARPEDAGNTKAMLDPILSAGRYSAIEGPVPLDELAAHIARACEAGVATLACGEDGVMGFQEVLPDEDMPGVAQVGTFVALDRHGLGIGRAMLAASEGQAGALGLGRVIGTIRGDNRGAQAFYAACGFADIGRKASYIVRNGRPIDAVVKEKAL